LDDRKVILPVKNLCHLFPKGSLPKQVEEENEGGTRHPGSLVKWLKIEESGKQHIKLLLDRQADACLMASFPGKPG